MMIVLLRTVRIFPERRGFSPRFLGTCKVPELFYCSVKFQRRRTFEKQVKSRVCSRIYIYSSIVLIIYYIYSQFFYIFVLHFSCFFPVFRGFSLALSEFFRNFGTIELYPANPMILNENQKFQPS